MIPVRVYVENFMSYRQGQELLFDSAPLWVLAGENGTGKSTVFDAITFTLYNCHRGGKQNHKDLINHQEDSLAVEFDFLINNLQYRIRRTVSRKSAATRQISEIDANKIKPISNTDNEAGFKDWIEHHIGLNDKAFTSCILLTQGNSDKLLTATSSERFAIIEQIIDLSAYKKLHEQADNLRKETGGELKGLEKQLENIPLISNEQLQVVQEKLNQAKNNWQIIQDRIEKLNQLVQQAKQWEQLQKQIQEQENKKQVLQQLIDRSEEITTNFNRLEELKFVIPKIQNILIAKQRLVNTEQEINNIDRNLQQIKHYSTQAETEQKESQEKCDRLQKSLADLQNNLQIITNTLSELAPLITKLEQYEQIKDNLEQSNSEIAKLPSDLSQQVELQENHYQQLTEIKNTLPWLKNIVESRSDLSQAIKQQQNTEERMRSLDSQLTEHKQHQAQLNIDFREIEKAEIDLSNQVNIEQANYQRVKKQLQSFEQAATQPTCELCGQEITPEHAQQEKQRLNQKLTEIDTSLNSLQQEYSIAKESLSRYQVELENVKSKITNTEQDINQNRNLEQQAKANSKRLIQQLNKDWENLPVRDRALISPNQPHNESEWLNTLYPNNTDLEQLNYQINTIETNKQNLDNLRQQLEQWKLFNNQRQTYDKQLVECQSEFSIIEAQQAKQRSKTLKLSQLEINQTIQQGRQELEQAKKAKEDTDTKVKKYSDQSQRLEIELKGKRTSYVEIENNLEIKDKELPEQWQKKVDSLNRDRLQELQQQSSQLTKYENLAHQLHNAQQSLEYSIQQIASYHQQIEQLPKEAHRLSQKIEEELIAAKEERDKSDREKSNVEKELNKLEDTQQRYHQIEQDKLQAERNSNLYKTLSELLGKKGIQLYILRNAEKAIIEIANEILDSLSRGTIRLELRGENKETDDALDLVAYNFATGNKPTAVALTSGSQRFRIAVSLALAIGQYVGNNTRNIESVIIDEGFGSLDKNGRDDMIEELNELKQRLKRIILVSHQEEFFNEFNNGYKVELIEGASQVSLLESSF